jgi:predicted nucleic-acid-binding protein
MLHIEVMHVERIRTVHSVFNNTILKEAKREQIESEHQRLFADQKLRQDRVFIMRNFMIYYEIGKLLSSSTTTNRQALCLIQTIVREDNMVVQAKAIVREIAHRFKVCNI